MNMYDSRRCTDQFSAIYLSGKYIRINNLLAKISINLPSHERLTKSLRIRYLQATKLSNLFFSTWKKEFEEENARKEGTFSGGGGGVGGDRIWFTLKVRDRLKRRSSYQISFIFLYDGNHEI